MLSFAKFHLMLVQRRLPVVDGLRHNAATLLGHLTKLKVSRRQYCKERLETLQCPCSFVSYVFSSEVFPELRKEDARIRECYFA
jgi:hypothetical protein